MSKFFLAAGHGWRDDGSTDPGAVSGSRIERDIAISLIDQAVAILKGQDTKGREIVVINHRLVDAVPSINQLSTDNAHDLACELHLNSNAGAPGTGVETYYGLPSLATEMNNAIVGELGLANRGVKDGNWLYFNNSTNCASCLVEIGFINNDTDMAKVLAKGGLALAKAVLVGCGSAYKAPVAVTPPPTPVTTWKVYDANGVQVGAYTVLANAQNKLDSIEAGTIKDSNGVVIKAKVKPAPIVQPIVPPVTPPVVPPVVPTKELTLLEWVQSIIKIVTDFLASWHKK